MQECRGGCGQSQRGNGQTRLELRGRKFYLNLKDAKLDRLGSRCTGSGGLAPTSAAGPGKSLAWGHDQSSLRTTCFAEE